MSKRCASPTLSSPVTCKMSRIDDEVDDRHTRDMAEWESVQSHVSKAMQVPFKGMISKVDAVKSFRAHMDDLKDKGYAFGTYNTDRSLFEKLNRLVFSRVPDENMGSAVYDEAKNLLRQINKGAKPMKNTFSMLVMMSTEYVTPMANMVLLLSHPSSTSRDLDLFWELTDRIWCFAHPVYHLHSGYLDETCAKITTRLSEVGECS